MALAKAIHRFLARRRGDTRGRVTLRYRQLYILPTAQGWLFAVLLLALWLAATNYRLNLGFALTFLLAGTALVAMHHCYRNLAGVTVIPADATPTWEGETAYFPLTLENTARKRRIAIVADAGHGGVAVDVAADDTSVLHLPVTAGRRGRLLPGRVRIESRQPTGLFLTWSWLEPAVEAVVYPRPETPAPPLPEHAPGAASGIRGTAAGDDDFQGLRGYRPGDPVQRIAWKATTASELQVKVFAGSPGAERWLDWRATAGLDTEARLQRLAAWVEASDRGGARYGLRLPTVVIPPGEGPAHRHRCLEALAVFPA